MDQDTDNRITPIGRTNYRGDAKAFGIKRPDRRYHMLAIGKTGTGKSTLLEAIMRSDLESGEGLALLDPHGDLCERVLASVPENRRGDLVYFDAGDPECCRSPRSDEIWTDRRGVCDRGLSHWATGWRGHEDGDLRRRFARQAASP